MKAEDIEDARQFLLKKGYAGFANNSSVPQWLVEYAELYAEQKAVEFLTWVGKDGYPCIDNIKKGLWVLHPQEPKDFTPHELYKEFNK